MTLLRKKRPIWVGLSGGLPIPAAPTLDTPADEAIIEGFTTTLQWDDVPGAATYDVQIATDSAFSSVVQSDTGLATSEYTINPALNLRNYYWRVRGVNAGGTAGAWSTARQFITSQVVFTQSVGSELLTDGGMENWNSATDLVSWTESLFGSSTVNREATDKHGGSFACRQDIDASNSNVLVQQIVAGSVGDTLEVSIWTKESAAGKTARLSVGNTNGRTFTVPTADYQQFTDIIQSTFNLAVYLNRVSTASSSLYSDDYSAKKLTFNVLQTATANAEHVFTFAVPVSPIAGMRISLRYRVNSSTPNADYMNFHLLRNDANTAWSARLRRVVSGTESTPVGWSDVADVGTPDAIKVVANGDKHNLFTRASGVWTQRESEITETNQQTSTGVLAVYSTGTTPESLYSTPL